MGETQLEETQASGVAALGSIGSPALVRERAYEHLRDAIVAGQLPPGTRLVERELCEALGVSRTSLREALRRLEAQKLIDSEGRRGPTVARLTRDQASQIYTLRQHLEGELFACAAREITAAGLARLTDALARFQDAAAEADVRRAVDVMVDFYSLAGTLPGVDVIQEVLTELTARVSYLRFRTMSHPGRIGRSVAEMAAIVEAVSARDPDTARRAAVAHIEEAAKIALHLLAD